MNCLAKCAPQRQAVGTFDVCLARPKVCPTDIVLPHAAQLMIDTSVNQFCKIWPNADWPLVFVFLFVCLFVFWLALSWVDTSGVNCDAHYFLLLFDMVVMTICTFFSLCRMKRSGWSNKLTSNAFHSKTPRWDFQVWGLSQLSGSLELWRLILHVSRYIT